MALCVRKIDHRRHWEAPRKEETWLGVEDLRADALQDLGTDENKLSIYEIDDATGVSLSRILAALAAGRDSLAKLDFVVFDFAIVEELGIAHDRVDGTTLDAAVNARHLDLVHLTARKLADFGGGIRARGKVERYQDKKVAGLIRESVARGFLDASRLTPSVADKLRQ